MKKTFALVLALLALFTYTALAAGADIQKTVYEGMGVVEVDFLYDVQYQNFELTVQDENGNTCEFVIWERDDDEITFRVKDVLPGTYSYTVSGLRAGFSGEYGSVSGSFTVPEQEKSSIKKVEYDFGDRELDVEFISRVDLGAAEVRLWDADGNEYELKIREVDRDGFEAYAPDLEWGRNYTIEVGGLGDGTESAVFEFTAIDD